MLPIEIDEDKMYFFTVLSENKYHTVFIGWLRVDLIKAFHEVDGVSSFANIRMNIGENTFISHIGAPLYLLEYDDDAIFDFAEGIQELDLYPSGNYPDNLDMEPIVDYPSYFTKDVEPLIKFKLFNKFWTQIDGDWLELDI